MSTERDDVRRQEVLARAAVALASELSLPVVLQTIVDLACEAAGARYAALGVIGMNARVSQFLTHGLTPEERAAIGPLPEGKGLLGALIDDERTLRLHAIQDDPRSVGFPPNHPPMRTFLGVPVRIRGHVFGNLYLTEKREGKDFNQADEDAVVQLAAQAAIAIDYARLHEQLQRLAMSEERERIAKELHDDVIQSLFAEGMALQAAEALIHDPEAMRARLGSAVENIDRVIRDLRNYIFGLVPGALADRQLDIALHELAAGFRGSSASIDVQADPEAVSRLAGRAAVVIQAAREALSNAVRHSGASHILVSLTWDGERATLEIRDDGGGFDPSAAAGTGHGLANLRSRAEALGGELTIDAAPGRGSRVCITIPV